MQMSGVAAQIVFAKPELEFVSVLVFEVATIQRSCRQRGVEYQRIL